MTLIYHYTTSIQLTLFNLLTKPYRQRFTCRDIKNKKIIWSEIFEKCIPLIWCIIEFGNKPENAFTQFVNSIFSLFFSILETEKHRHLIARCYVEINEDHIIYAHTVS